MRVPAEVASLTARLRAVMKAGVGEEFLETRTGAPSYWQELVVVVIKGWVLMVVEVVMKMVMVVMVVTIIMGLMVVVVVTFVVVKVAEPGRRRRDSVPLDLPTCPQTRRA